MRKIITFTLLIASLLIVSSCDDERKKEAEYYAKKMRELEEAQYMNTRFGDPEHVGQVKGVDGRWYDVNDNNAYISDSTDGYRNDGDLYNSSEDNTKPKLRRHDDGI